MKRRSFLKRVGQAVAGIAIVPALAKGADTKTVKPKPKPDLKYDSELSQKILKECQPLMKFSSFSSIGGTN